MFARSSQTFVCKSAIDGVNPTTRDTHNRKGRPETPCAYSEHLVSTTIQHSTRPLLPFYHVWVLPWNANNNNHHRDQLSSLSAVMAVINHQNRLNHLNHLNLLRCDIFVCKHTLSTTAMLFIFMLKSNPLAFICILKWFFSFQHTIWRNINSFIQG